MVLICTNTMHKVAGEVVGAVGVPLLHIVDMTADELEHACITTVGLLGTRYTMEQDFYTGVLEHRGISVLTPVEKDRALVNRVIFDELCLGESSQMSPKQSSSGHYCAERQDERFRLDCALFDDGQDRFGQSKHAGQEDRRLGERPDRRGVGKACARSGTLIVAFCKVGGVMSLWTSRA